ncbi:ATP-binding protein [Iodidimonas sp. SYSU 1G8]|uniref:ATP-binding protein n=1 Tax=Iodidimonas sp. SYSU 1G8 TaxID=3133967 RepID=UPI0031FE5C84
MPRGHLKASVRLLVAIVATISAVLLATHAIQLYLDRGWEADKARDSLRNIVQGIAKHTEQTLGTTDRGLIRFADELSTGTIGADSPPGAIHETLGAARNAAPSVLEFFIVDATGRIAQASYSPVPDRLNLAQEPPFAPPPASGDRRIRVSPPLVGKLGEAVGEPIIRVARPGMTADGQLQGWAVGTIAVDHFASLFESLSLTPRTAIMLFRDDGILLAERVGGASSLINPDMRESLFKEHVKGRDSGWFWTESDENQTRHMMVFARVPGLPMVVAAGLPESEVLANWTYRALTSFIVDLILLSLMAGATALAVRALSLRQQAQVDTTDRLNRLASISAELAAARSIDHVLNRAAAAARELVPCHQSVVSLTIGDSFAQAIHTVSLSEKYAAWRTYDEQSDGSGIYRLVCRDNAPTRLTQEELLAHPDWKGFGDARDRHPPMRGWLAVPLMAQTGENLGLIGLSDRDTGEFDAQDEALLAQLARTVSIAVENVKLLGARTDALAATEAARDEISRIFEAMSDGVYHLDANWRYTHVNRAAEEMFGVSEAEVLGKSMWEVFPDLYGSDVWTRFHQAVERREQVTFENYYAPLDRFHMIRLFPGSSGLTVYTSDITQRMKAEQQLRQAQKMEAVGQLTGGVAHDFNNLLTVIMGNADLLVEEVRENDRLRMVAEMIQTAAERGADLTHRLLAFSRRQPLAPKIIDVNQLITGLEALLRRTLNESIDLEIVRGAGLWRAVVDGSQLESALLNIAINARDAMGEGGKLTIETANARLDNSYALDNDEVKPGQYVMVALSDTGEGMEAKVLERAFDPFFTTKPVGKGSGLGLSMVYGFAKQSGGHVKLYSEPGYGTTVKLYLPRALDRHIAVEAARPDAELSPHGQERIALVEDEALVRQFAEMNLRHLGYEVTAFATGPDLLAAMDQGLAFDLLFTDIVLPGGMNGRQIAEEVLRRAPGTRVLYSSGYTDNAIVHHGRLDDGVNLLNKPFRKTEMAQKVRAVLDGRDL